MAEIRARQTSIVTPSPDTSSYCEEANEEHKIPERSWMCDMTDEANSFVP